MGTPQLVCPLSCSWIFGRPQCGAVVNKAAINIYIKTLCGPQFKFPLGKYPGELLSHMLRVCLT